MVEENDGYGDFLPSATEEVFFFSRGNGGESSRFCSRGGRSGMRSGPRGGEMVRGRARGGFNVATRSRVSFGQRERGERFPLVLLAGWEVGERDIRDLVG